jgi:hypothetical protein
MSRLLTIASVCAAFALTACGGDDDDPMTDDNPTSSERSALAETVAATAIHEDGGEIGAMADSVVVINGLGIPSLDIAAEGRFIGTKGRFELTFDVTCYDDDDVEMDCDATAARGEVEASWLASLSLPRRETEASYSGAWTIERQPGDRFRVDGRGDMRLDSDFASASGKNTKTADLHWSAAYVGLIIDRDVQRAPIAGRVDYDVDYVRTHNTPGRDREDVVNAEATLTFDGDASTLVVDDERYRVDTRADGHAKVTVIR